ncbi:LysR family transcriptional regulator [Pelomonas sp. Root1444]|uniref:LysR family transcriptional regulator n=1 Tax=Pelomonas sp. Root1444 TaxID=1736464 RepID=UPI000703A4B6|nr:LysR family transcriptional regulator [Pelomonas sp. Root1444]KQY88226.1 LysR family transcriptional regulator [Pelomonas sp. Root1444]
MLDALTLGQIRTFVAIADAGGFRAGAARLRRAQSAVSHAVSSLEEELGVQLFDRSKRRPELTLHGRALLEDARAVLLKVDGMRARAHGLGAGLELQLPVVVDTLFPLPLACQALRAMNEAFPSVQADVTVAPLGEPISALQQGRCVLAITVGEEFRDRRIVLHALAPVTVVPVVAAASPLAQRIREGWQPGPHELADDLQIVLADPSPLTKGRDIGVLSPRTWRVHSQSVKHALIAAGVGWGRLPAWQVEADIQGGRLVRIPVQAFGPGGQAQLQAFLAHRVDQRLGPAAQMLRQSLIAAVESMEGKR